MKIQDFAKCTLLDICQGFLKISILNYNNNMMVNADGSPTQDRSLLRAVI